MRLIHITTVPETLYSFFEGQLQFMRCAGLDVLAITSPGDTLEEFKNRERIEVFTVPMVRKITPFRDVNTLLRMWLLLRRLKPEIVHAHTPKGGLLGIIAACLAAVPIKIYHIHGFPFMTAPGWKKILLQMTEKISCLLADQIFCVSRSIQELAVGSRICAPGKIKTLHHGSINGIDTLHKFNPARFTAAERAQIRCSCGIPADRLVIGYVGRITLDKGIVDLAAAWELLRKTHADSHLLLVGPSEEENPVPAEILKRFAADPRVHMVGAVLDTSPLYAAMDVLVLPSHREGFGLANLEAAAMEVPVVATLIPGCMDAVADGVTGILVPPHAPPALYQAMRRYLDDPALRAQHGRAGRTRAVSLFEQGAVWRSLHTEYLNLAGNAGIGMSPDRRPA